MNQEQVEQWLLEEIQGLIRPWEGRVTYEEDQTTSYLNPYVRIAGVPGRFYVSSACTSLLLLRSGAIERLNERTFRDMISWYVKNPK